MKDAKLPRNLSSIDPLSVGMQNPCLCQARQGFMKALHHQIRSLGHGTLRKARIQAKVRPMGLIHQNRNAFLMRYVANRFHIAECTPVSTNILILSGAV